MTAAKIMGVKIYPQVLRVGGVALTGRALLAPMAGVTDPAMRRIAERYGATATVSEMVAAAGVARGDRETAMRLSCATPGHGASPRVIQIAARDADGAAAAARCAEDAGADWVDINMGCPCKRVTGGLAGAALMRDLDQAVRMIAITRSVIRVPLSIKMRLGWDESSRNAPDLARRAEQEGVSLITVHGRTRQQFYSGRADWFAIAAVKQAVGVPVIANGDCASPSDAAEMLRISGADGVMIGRAAQGRPWIAGDIAHFLDFGQPRTQPSLVARGLAAREHLDGLLSLMGSAGLRHARKHLAAYVDHAFGAARAEIAEMRRALVTTESPQEADQLLGLLFSGNHAEAAT